MNTVIGGSGPLGSLWLPLAREEGVGLPVSYR